MGRYSPIEIFNKEPAVIAGAIRTVLYGAVILGVVHLTVEQLAGIAVGLEVVLGLFVRQSVTPNVTVAQIVQTPTPPATVPGAGPIAAAEAAGVDTAKPPAGG